MLIVPTFAFNSELFECLLKWFAKSVYSFALAISLISYTIVLFDGEWTYFHFDFIALYASIAVCESSANAHTATVCYNDVKSCCIIDS